MLVYKKLKTFSLYSYLKKIFSGITEFNKVYLKQDKISISFSRYVCAEILKSWSKCIFCCLCERIKGSFIGDFNLFHNISTFIADWFVIIPCTGATF